MNAKIYLIIRGIKPNRKSNTITFFPELKTMSWILSPTTTLTGSLLSSEIGSDLKYGAIFSS